MEGHEMEFDMAPKPDAEAVRRARIQENVTDSLPLAKLAVDPKEWGKVDELAKDINNAAEENGEAGALRVVNSARAQDESEIEAKRKEKREDARTKLALAA